MVEHHRNLGEVLSLIRATSARTPGGQMGVGGDARFTDGFPQRALARKVVGTVRTGGVGAQCLDIGAGDERVQYVRAVWMMRVQRADAGRPVTRDGRGVPDEAVVVSVKRRRLDQQHAIHTVCQSLAVQQLRRTGAWRRTARLLDDRVSDLVQRVDVGVRVNNHEGGIESRPPV